MITFQDHPVIRSLNSASLAFPCQWYTRSTASPGTVGRAELRCMLHALHGAGGRNRYGLSSRVWSWKIYWRCRVWHRNYWHCGSNDWSRNKWQTGNRVGAFSSNWTHCTACRRKTGVWTAYRLAARKTWRERDSWNRREKNEIDATNKHKIEKQSKGKEGK